MSARTCRLLLAGLPLTMRSRRPPVLVLGFVPLAVPMPGLAPPRPLVDRARNLAMTATTRALATRTPTADPSVPGRVETFQALHNESRFSLPHPQNECDPYPYRAGVTFKLWAILGSNQ